MVRVDKKQALIAIPPTLKAHNLSSMIPLMLSPIIFGSLLIGIGLPSAGRAQSTDAAKPVVITVAPADDKKMQAILHNSLGVKLFKIGDFKGAITEFAWALTYDHQYFMAKNNMAAAWISWGRAKEKDGDLEMASRLYYKAVHLNGSATAYSNLVPVLAKLGRIKEAEEISAKSIELSPNSPAAWVNRGFVLAMAKNYKGALAAYQKALTLNPADDSLLPIIEGLKLVIDAKP
jgi:tetratricopeptide (TPR) repeat protein